MNYLPLFYSQMTIKYFESMVKHKITVSVIYRCLSVGWRAAIHRQTPGSHLLPDYPQALRRKNPIMSGPVLLLCSYPCALGYELSNTTGPEGFGAAGNPIVYRGFFSWTIFICFLISLVYFDTWPHILPVFSTLLCWTIGALFRSTP